MEDSPGDEEGSNSLPTNSKKKSHETIKYSGALQKVSLTIVGSLETFFYK